MSFRQSILLTLGLFVWVFTYNTWQFLGNSTYYIGTAFIVFVASLIINHNTKDNFQKLISKTFVFLSANNLIDEIFFDPTEINIHEYLSFIIYTMYLCKTYYTKRSKGLDNG